MDIMSLVLSFVPYVLGIGVVGSAVVVFINFLKEVSDVLISVVNALEDSSISKEEVANIVKEAKEVVEAAKKFSTIGKK